MEIPVQAWQDVYLREKYGWANFNAYLKHGKEDLDYIFDHNLVWNYVQHDWSSIKSDPEMTITRGIIIYSLKKEIRIMSYQEYYEEVKSGTISD